MGRKQHIHYSKYTKNTRNMLFYLYIIDKTLQEIYLKKNKCLDYTDYIAPIPVYFLYICNLHASRHVYDI